MATNVPAGTVIGSIALNGSLSDWTDDDRIDNVLSEDGYDVFARPTGGSLLIALRAPVSIGAGSTVWFNTDQNETTGHQIFGFAGGAEYNINFNDEGVPQFFTGDEGETLVGGVTVSYTTSADGLVVEMAVLSTIGSPTAVNTLFDINDEVYLPTAYELYQYEIITAPRNPVVGSVTLNGDLSEWSDSEQIDNTMSVTGYHIFARVTGGSLVFALWSAEQIGPNTTVWINADQNASTGFQIFGFAGGAEYNINFDIAGTPRLYTGDAGQTLVPGATVSYGSTLDRLVMEFAVPLSAIGSPNAVNTLWDVNDETYLPTAYQLAQYEVITGAVSQVVGSVTLDGSLGEWTASEQIDDTLGVAGYDVYARATGGSLVFALHAPVAIGPNTTAWLNTDQNPTTGFQIFGFAGGAEYNINFDIAGTPRLYTGDEGQTLVPGAIVSWGANADRTTVEFAVALSAIGNPNAVNTLWDVNDVTFLPTSYQLAQYDVVISAPPSQVVGSVTLDGSLAEWTAAEQIDDTLGVAGYDVYARATGGSLVFALHAPVAIGPNTTAWLNTDQNAATGFQIFGFAGGAEYNINFDAAGTPRLYTGDEGQTLVPGAAVSYRANADRTTVEFAVSLAAIGSPNAVNTLWDVNDETFLPTAFQLAQYDVVIVPPSPVVGTITIDGNIAGWNSLDLIDQSLSVAGYDIYARVTGNSYVFAVEAPVAIGANTTVWLNTDQNAATGFQIFGFAGGAEFNVNFDVAGTPRLYTGDAGQTLVPGAVVQHAYSADHRTVEFSVLSSALGSPDAINTLWDINDNTYLPTAYFLTQYPVVNAAAPDPTVGSVTVNGSLSEWTTSDFLDTALSVAGYDILARVTGGSLVFGVLAPTPIGAGTTVWLNTDANTATGFRVFGSTVGAELNINFDQSGTPHLYSGDAGQTLQTADVLYAYNADHTNLEFAVPLAALGSPATVQTSWDVNNSVFLPTDFSLMQYGIDTTTGAISAVVLI